MEKCQDHSGICHDVDQLKGSDKEQWVSIHSKVSSKQMWAVVAIFVTLATAIVGFLWNTQTGIAERMFLKIDIVEQKREVMDKKLDLIDFRVKQMNHNDKRSY